MLPVVPWTPSGTKRTRSVARSRSALPDDTVPTLAQVVPPFTLYCQVPLPETRLVIAMPCTAPLSTSVMLLPTTLATVWPALPVSPSVSPVSVGEAGVSTGASLTALTTRLACAVPVE